MTAMTEAEWLTGTDIGSMLEFLLDRASDRKLHLFACACCRRVWQFIPGPCGRRLVEVQERVADGMAGGEELEAAAKEARRFVETEVARNTEVSCSAAYAAAYVVGRYPGERAAWAATAAAHCGQNTFHWVATEAAVSQGATNPDISVGEAAEAAEAAVQAMLLRDIVGNAFRSPTLDPDWLTWNEGAVAGLAQAAYDERLIPEGHLDPARLAVLADALEDAGCPDADILGHLRSPGSHVRGCWVVDLLLGKG